MAKSIQIRGVPDRIHRALRTRAQAAGSSLSDYLLRELVRIADRPPVADVLARAEQRTEAAEVGSIVDAVRSGRDRAIE